MLIQNVPQFETTRPILAGFSPVRPTRKHPPVRAPSLGCSSSLVQVRHNLRVLYCRSHQELEGNSRQSAQKRLFLLLYPMKKGSHSCGRINKFLNSVVIEFFQVMSFLVLLAFAMKHPIEEYACLSLQVSIAAGDCHQPVIVTTSKQEQRNQTSP